MLENVEYRLISTVRQTELFGEAKVYNKELEAPLFLGFALVLDGEGGDTVATRFVRTKSFLKLLSEPFQNGEAAFQEAIRTTVCNDSITEKYVNELNELAAQTLVLGKELIENKAPWPEVICK